MNDFMFADALLNIYYRVHCRFYSSIFQKHIFMSAHTYFQLLSVICLTSRTNAGLPLQAQVDYDPELMQPDTRFFAKVSVVGAKDNNDSLVFVVDVVY